MKYGTVGSTACHNGKFKTTFFLAFFYTLLVLLVSPYSLVRSCVDAHPELYIRRDYVSC